MGRPRILSICVVTYALICQHSCEKNYGRSLCVPLFRDSEHEQCGGEQELEATNDTKTLIGKPECQDFKPGSLRSCLWTIKSSNGSSIAINITRLQFEHKDDCWDNALIIYEGKGVTDPERTVYSKCTLNDTEKIHTGWNQLTISLRAYERFIGSQFLLEYNSYPAEDQSPVIRLSFDPFPSCSKPSPKNETEPTFIFNRMKKGFVELFIYYCVFPMENLTSVVLKAPSNELASRWTTQCDHTVCFLGTRNLIPPLSGNYTFVAAIRRTRAKIRFQILLQNPAQMHTHNYASGLPYQIGKSYYFYCDFLGEPVPDASWYFYPSKGISSCHGQKWEHIKNWTIPSTKLVDNDYNSRIKQGVILFHCEQRDYRLRVDLVAETSGCLLCRTGNAHGDHFAFEPVPVSATETDFFVSRSDNETLVDEPFSMSCSANTFNYLSLDWNFQPKLGRKPVSNIALKKEYNVTLDQSENNLTRTVTLHFQKVSLVHEGFYVCTARKTTLKEEKFREEIVSLNETLTVISVPAFIGKSYLATNEQVSMVVQEGSTVTLNCSAKGMRPLTYTWSKVMPDGLPMQIEGFDSDSSQNGVMVLKKAGRHGGNEFSCTVANEAGTISKDFHLQFTQADVGEVGTLNDSSLAVISASVIFVLILIVVAILLWRWRKKKHEQAKTRIILTARGSGPTEESIPFDVFWEFPEQRLTLEEKIGQGAYGKVVKAQAYGICPHESVSTVAVKMLKANADSLQKKALFAELKILSRLGKHPNVVSLLGAVTKIQSSGRLYIIVEYCEKGSLHNYLLKQRKHFICQVHQETGKLDRNLCSYPFLKKHKDITTQQLDEGISDSQGTSSRSLENSNLVSAKTVDTGISTSSSTVPSLISLASNTEPPLTTMELIKFSFQCARGMEYISSRKLNHRDLSIRNVLLTKDNIIKICDFGLTRDDMYLYNDQKKTALPVRWMAPESLGQNQFSIKTDIWSFGILLWEMFTLGDTPYPGMPIDESFYKKIFSGYRLTPPEMSPNEISKLMTDCWQEASDDRPDFSEIVEILGDYLDDQTKNYYLTLDEAYKVMRKIKEPTDEYVNMDGKLLMNWMYEALPDSNGAPEDETTL